MVIPSPRLASTSTRVAAALIDVVVTLIVFTVPSLVLGAILLDDSFALSRFTTIGVFIYEVVLTCRYGQTIGKMAVKIVVVDDEGAPPTARDSIVRYLVKTLAPLLLIDVIELNLLLSAYSIALLVVISKDPQRRGWHDRAAATTVFDVAQQDEQLRPAIDG